MICCSCLKNPIWKFATTGNITYCTYLMQHDSIEELGTVVSWLPDFVLSSHATAQGQTIIYCSWGVDGWNSPGVGKGYNRRKWSPIWCGEKYFSALKIQPSGFFPEKLGNSGSSEPFAWENRTGSGAILVPSWIMISLTVSSKSNFESSPLASAIPLFLYKRQP